MKIKNSFIRKCICSQFFSYGSFKDLQVRWRTQQGSSLLVRSKAVSLEWSCSSCWPAFTSAFDTRGELWSFCPSLSPFLLGRGRWWDSSRQWFWSGLVLLTRTCGYIWRYFCLSELWRLILSFVIVGQWYFLQSTRKNYLTQNFSST